MSKHAIQALVSAAAADKELKEVLETGKGSVFNHVVNSILSLSPAEMDEVKSLLANEDTKKPIIGEADKRNNPGPGGGSAPAARIFG